MASKEIGFLEKHIEKIVLLVICCVSVFLLFYFVLRGPCKVRVDNRVFGPGSIDNYVWNVAKEVQTKLEKPPVQPEPYVRQSKGYIEKINKPVTIAANVFARLLPPQQGSASVQSPKYNLPEIPPIESPKLELIRTVAYIPRSEVTAENTYGQVSSEVNDIDLVTVEFKFDIAGLYKSFNNVFASPKIKEQWRNKEIAEPIIAAVQLQRQQMLPDGTWPANWEDVPRSKVDAYSKLLNVIEDVDKLPTGGMDVRLLQYKEKNVQLDLLQPDWLRVASAKDEWFPPSLHSRFKSILDSELLKQRRVAAEAEKERRNTLAATRAAMRAAGADAAALAATGASLLTSTTDLLQSSAFDSIYKEFDKMLITEKTELAKMTEPVTIWVFDDSVEPQQNYKYRVRLGIFNPIAGTDQFAENNSPSRNKAILWTEFVEPQNVEPSKETYYAKSVVQVPARLYIFPISVYNESKKQINVNVARHKFGYWYVKDYRVLPGDAIGKVERIKTESDTEENPAAAFLQATSSAPSQIDYSTGQIMLDAVQSSEWTGGNNLYQRSFFQMLHSRDGTDIERTPIGDKFWPEEMLRNFAAVKADEKKPNTPVEPFRQFADAKDRLKERTQQKQPAATTPSATVGGVDTGLLELMLKRQGITMPQ